jgi:hypothetical protein
MVAARSAAFAASAHAAFGRAAPPHPLPHITPRTHMRILTVDSQLRARVRAACWHGRRRGHTHGALRRLRALHFWAFGQNKKNKILMNFAAKWIEGQTCEDSQSPPETTPG